MQAKTLYDKIVDAHTIKILDSAFDERLVFIDRTVINEYTSPQAFTLLRENNRSIRHPRAVLGTIDHVNSSAPDRDLFPSEENACRQVRYLIKNGKDFGFDVYNVDHASQGIEHVVMCEEGRVLPGMLIGAGDSHTAMYGALGCVGYGIGTSDIYHYMATSTLRYKKLKNMAVRLKGLPSKEVSPKDLILFVVRALGAGGCSGYCAEFFGEAIEALSVEGRLTFCNMAVECGARSSLIAPDDKTIEFLKACPKAPQGAFWEKALAYWRTLQSDKGAFFDKEIEIDVSAARPMVTWGTSPDQSVCVDEKVPSIETAEESARCEQARALCYMGFKGGEKLSEIPITHAFIGSCTNSRMEDIREAAQELKGRKIASGVTAWLVPGSMRVWKQAESEGLLKIFEEAGWDIRKPGCSLCLAMNGDILGEHDRCISATNRNFEGRQGVGTRTHLASPRTVAKASVSGFLGED